MYALSLNKFFLDEIYSAVIVFPLRKLALVAAVFDVGVIAQLVACVGHLPRLFSAIPRILQNGLVPSYALVMFVGVIAGLLYAMSFLK